MIDMRLNTLFITKPKWTRDDPTEPFMNYSYTPGAIIFPYESLNYNTFIRPFAHDNRERELVEKFIVEEYRVYSWDDRLMDTYPDEFETEERAKEFIERIWYSVADFAKQFTY